MFLTAADVEELTGYRRYSKQRQALDRNAIPYFVAASGRPVVKHVDLLSEQPEPDKPVDYVYSTGPWYALGLTIEEWKKQNWESLYVPATALWARRMSRRGLETEDSGVYFLYANDGELLYVGLSISIQNRIIAHHRQRQIPFTHVSWVAMHQWLMKEVEAAYIHNLLPPYNIKGMPEVE